MKKVLQSPIVPIIAIVFAYVGFRWVTQAGQGLDAVQNDGYGGSGGMFILVAGILIGLWLSTKKLR